MQQLLWKAACLLSLYLFITPQAFSQCKNPDKPKSLEIGNMNQGKTFGQSIVADANCLGGGKFGLFSFTAQGNSQSSFKMEIFKVVNGVKSNLIHQQNVNFDPTYRGRRVYAEIEGDVSFIDGDEYLFLFTCTGGQMMPQTTATSTAQGKAYFNGSFQAGTDLCYVVRGKPAPRDIPFANTDPEQCKNPRPRGNKYVGQFYSKDVFGQSIVADSRCLEGNTFSQFKFWAQGNSRTKWELRIFDKETINFDNPRYTQKNISFDPPNFGKWMTIDLEGGEGDLSFVSGNTYTFLLTCTGGNTLPHATDNVTLGSAFYEGGFDQNIDFRFEVYGKEVEKSTASQVATFKKAYPTVSARTDFMEVVETFLKAEDEVMAGDYTAAKATLDPLWVKYPKGDLKWEQVSSNLNGVWVGAPVAYNSLRVLDDVVKFHTTSSNTPCTTPQKMKVKVVLVGKSTGKLPTTLTQLTGGTGPQTTKAIDPRLRANNDELIHELLRLFNQYIYVSTGGKVEVEVEVIELENMEYSINVRQDVVTQRDGSTKTFNLAYGEPVPGLNDNYPNIWPALEAKKGADFKHKADMWFIMYPSFVPGIGQEPATTPDNVNTLSFLTGGKTTSEEGAPVLWCDDLFFLEKQLHLGGGPLTDIERRCYAAMWFQHEFYHHLFDAFPTFRNLRATNSSIPTDPDNLEAESHIWQEVNHTTRVPLHWPSDFDGRYEADYFHEAMDKRFKLVTEGPLENRLIVRRDAIPANVFSQLTISEIVGDYEALVADPTGNDFWTPEIVRGPDYYEWIVRPSTDSNPLFYRMQYQDSDGTLRPGPGNTEARMQLKINPNTCLFEPKVIGMRHRSGFILKKKD
ncbi:MAG: hypothetical protein AAFY71_23630 [Bacteroidota bacterium]